MFRSGAVESSVECPLEPLPSLHIPIDYQKEPLFFELQLDKSDGSMNVESEDAIKMSAQTPRLSQNSGKNGYHTNLLSTPYEFEHCGATTVSGKMRTSEPVSASHTSKKAPLHEYSETRSFVLRREAILRREQERMEELQRQDDIKEDIPTPIVLDLDPRMLQPTKATRLRTEFVARRLKQMYMSDASTTNCLKGRDICTVGHYSSTRNGGTAQTPVGRLTRSARLFKEHTSRRIQEMEQERIRKAQEEEGIIEKPIFIAHSSTYRVPQSSTTEKRPLETCFNRATRLLHQRIAERQAEIQKERDKEQAARDAILRPPRKTLDLEPQFQQGYNRNSPVRQHKCQHVQDKSNVEQPRTSSQILPDGTSSSSSKLSVDLSVKRVDYHRYNQKESSRGPDLGPLTEQERFSRTSCPLKAPQESSTKPRCLSASDSGRHQVACQKDGAPAFLSATCVIDKEAKLHHNAWKADASDHHLANRPYEDSWISIPHNDVNFNKALTDIPYSHDHALHSPESSNRLMVSSINEKTPNSQKCLKSDTKLFQKNACFPLDSHALGLGEKVSSKEMHHSTREDTSPSVAYSKRQVETPGHRKKVAGPSYLEVSRCHSRFLHSSIDTILCRPSLKAASLSRRSSSGTQTRCSSLMALISPLSYAVRHSMGSDTLTKYQTLYFVVMQRLRRRFYMLWKQRVSELKVGGCPVSSAATKLILMDMSYPSSIPGKHQKHVSLGMVNETSPLCHDLTGNRSESLPRGATDSQGPSVEGESPRIRVSISCPSVSTEDGPAMSKLAPNARVEIPLLSVEISLDPPHAVTLQGVASTQSSADQQGSLYLKRGLQSSFRASETCTIGSDRCDVQEATSEILQGQNTVGIDRTECSSCCDTVHERASLGLMENGVSPVFSLDECVESQNYEKSSSCSDKEVRDILALCSDDTSLSLNHPPNLSRPSPQAPTPWCISPALLSPSKAPLQHPSLGCVLPSEIKMNQTISSQQDSLQGGALERLSNVCDKTGARLGQHSFLTEGEKSNSTQDVALQFAEKDQTSIEIGEYHSSMLDQSNIDKTIFSASSVFPDSPV